MYCVKCGQRLADSARFCPACGEPVAAQDAAPEAYSYDGQWDHVTGADSGTGTYDRNDQEMNERLRRDREAAPRTGMSTASIVLGIISLVLVWVPGIPFILGLIGLILGLVGRGRGERSLSTAGITLSLLGMIFGAIITVVEVLIVLNVLNYIDIPALSRFGDLSDLSDLPINLPIGKNIRFSIDVPAVIRGILRDLI